MSNLSNVNRYQDLIFKRGYLISDIEVDKPNTNWEELCVGKYFVYYDKLNEIKYYEKNGSWVFLLGNTIDIENNTSSMDIISENLFKHLQKSEDDFFDYLDLISGRYILMYNYAGKTKIMSDATGMRGIAYSVDKTVISSHAQLLKMLTGSALSPQIKNEWTKKYGGYHIPGHFTPYENIFFLTPNTLLEIESKKIKRFFPRAPLTQKPVKEIALEISALVKAQFSILEKKHDKFLFSLTAGTDSRTTLALSKEIANKIQYFTYYKVSDKYPNGVRSLEIDRAVVGDMANNLNLEHNFIPLKEDAKSNDFTEFVGALKRNTFRSHSYRLAKFYYEELPREKLHIRSNILEIGRYFYRSKIALPAHANAKLLARCYSTDAERDEEVCSLFEKFYNDVEMDNIYNYDPYDIFYWEYRMGVWHSQLLLESDIAHDTFIPFNSRKILNLMLSVSNTNKKNNSIFNTIIDNNWPILNFWGINTIEKQFVKPDNEIDNYGLPLRNIKFRGSSIYDYSKKVSFSSKNIGNKVKFNMKNSAPMRGEFVEATLPIKTTETKFYQCIIHLRSPYENKKNKGRLKYQVFLNKKLLLEEDIAFWKETNQVNIHFKAEDEKSMLTIRVLSIKDCEEWNWGRAATMIIERFIVRDGKYMSEGSIEASSPHSVF
ncbi:hypothetical protein OPHB3_3531 [Oceanobacillus picturae]|uniref:Asparagine synthase n=1 Tax=Oceanobacillus picturae TaxID=171693 RepID=A0A0U9HA37_9BACI|nr:hypothetical protein [Oceanobacillus picturae]GAQ19559.1 hypothetical protein OPHB3_3531 [Oceanobacillus picturae]